MKLFMLFFGGALGSAVVSVAAAITEHPVIVAIFQGVMVLCGCGMIIVSPSRRRG